MKLIDNLPRLQDANLCEEVVLVRVDHNVVSKGKIKDITRIEATIPTIMRILREGGHPILMTHIGRPFDKKTGKFTISEADSVQPIVDYLSHKYGLNIRVAELPHADENGIPGIVTSINLDIADLRDGFIDMIYLPNTRWFRGEEAKGQEAEDFGKQLAGLADVYVNDAFGSWQPHVSCMGPTEYLQSYAGLLMQKEIEHLYDIFSPEAPFVGVVAGSKFDTKIGPLISLLDKVDHLILGGVIYNAYLCAKYGISIAGVGEDDIQVAKNFIGMAAKYPNRIVELPFVVESDILEAREEGKYRTVDIRTLKQGDKLNYVLDIDPASFSEESVKQVILGAKTIFVNAVMGFTPNFGDGSRAFYALVDENKPAKKLFGGGDTIQEFKNLLMAAYFKAQDNPTYYFFTGGGTILQAIEGGSAYDLEPVKALIRNKEEWEAEDEE
jgi:phosphoglycerate kinase